MSRLIDKGQYLVQCFIRKQNQINLTDEEILKYNSILNEWKLEESEIIDIWLEFKEQPKGRTETAKTTVALAFLKSLESKFYTQPWFLLGIIIILLGAILFCQIEYMQIVDNQVGLVLGFVGVLATFIVVGNYAQTQAAVKNVEIKISELEKDKEYILKTINKANQYVIVNLEMLANSQKDDAQKLKDLKSYFVLEDTVVRSKSIEILRNIAQKYVNCSVKTYQDVYWTVLYFNPQKEETEIAKSIIEMATDMTYFCFKQGKIAPAQYSLLILKYMHIHYREQYEDIEIPSQVKDKFKELENHSIQKKWGEEVQEMLRVFKKDLIDKTAVLPAFKNENLASRIEKEEKEEEEKEKRKEKEE